MGIFTKKAPISQSDKILKKIRKSGGFGVPNYELSKISLKYSSRIAELRKDGYCINATRVILPNGRCSGVWRYTLVDDSIK